jgi:hypothetical protein
MSCTNTRILSANSWSQGPAIVVALIMSMVVARQVNVRVSRSRGRRSFGWIWRVLICISVFVRARKVLSDGSFAVE